MPLIIVLGYAILIIGIAAAALLKSVSVRKSCSDYRDQGDRIWQKVSKATAKAKEPSLPSKQSGAGKYSDSDVPERDLDVLKKLNKNANSGNTSEKQTKIIKDGESAKPPQHAYTPSPTVPLKKPQPGYGTPKNEPYGSNSAAQSGSQYGSGSYQPTPPYGGGYQPSNTHYGSSESYPSSTPYGGSGGYQPNTQFNASPAYQTNTPFGGGSGGYQPNTQYNAGSTYQASAPYGGYQSNTSYGANSTPYADQEKRAQDSNKEYQSDMPYSSDNDTPTAVPDAPAADKFEDIYSGASDNEEAAPAEQPKSDGSMPLEEVFAYVKAERAKPTARYARFNVATDSFDFREDPEFPYILYEGNKVLPNRHNKFPTRFLHEQVYSWSGSSVTGSNRIIPCEIDDNSRITKKGSII